MKKMRKMVKYIKSFFENIKFCKKLKKSYSIIKICTINNISVNITNNLLFSFSKLLKKRTKC